MSFSEWSTGKKVAVILIIIVAITCVVGAITFSFVATQVTQDLKNTNITIGGENSSSSTFSIPQGQYSINIKTDNSWNSYITTDGKYSQSSGSGDKTIDLGTISDYSSITINQQGSGTIDVTVTDSSGKVVHEGKTSTDYGSVYILLDAK
ncbi:MAG: hypothetical protein ACRCVG_05015 [Methanobacteriaceae archaeon]